MVSLLWFSMIKGPSIIFKNTSVEVIYLNKGFSPSTFAERGEASSGNSSGSFEVSERLEDTTIIYDIVLKMFYICLSGV